MKRRPAKGKESFDSKPTTTQPVATPPPPLTKLDPCIPTLGTVWLTSFQILLLLLCSVKLFGDGFLLSRIELSNISALGEAPRFQRFSRVVFILIDALRFDFVTTREAKTTRYAHQLPFLEDMLRNSPSNSLLLRARADPPTTTLQRLKALVTGTLPTFVDAGSNFGSTAIAEDNLISQLVSNGRRVIFMGDDTWDGLFPTSFNQSYPYPSFNVQDLHTVDNGCIEHLFAALDRPEDWDVAIAHFLGVDHVGHSFGPDTIPMTEKLTQVNGWLQDIFRKVDNDALVVVLGDHGMDPKGDHGGDSENEVNAGLFLYSKKQLWDHDAPGRFDLDALLQDLDSMETTWKEPFVFSEGFRTIPQIDLVPTISALLGVPIPFGNLGSIIPELFYLLPEGELSSFKTKEERLLAMTSYNARQIFTYLNEYSKQRLAADFMLDKLAIYFQDAEARYSRAAEKRGWADKETAPKSGDDLAEMKAIYIDYMKFMRTALMAARRVWARFDVPLIILGLVLFISTAAYTSLVIFAWWTATVRIPSSATISFWVGGTVSGVLGLSSGVVRDLVKFLPSDEVDSVLTLSHEVLFSGGLGAILSFSLAFLWLSRKGKILPGKISRFSAVQWALGLVLLGGWIGVPASDSFTIYEESVLLHLLQTFGVYVLLVGLLAKKEKTRKQLLYYALAFLALTRFSHISTICREEKAQTCFPTFNSLPNSSVASPFAVVGLLFSTLTAIFTLRSALKSTNSLNGTGKFLLESFLPLGVSVSYIYWVLDTLQGYQYFVGDWKFMIPFKIWWAKIGFLASSGVCLYVWSSEPTCLTVTTVTKKEAMLGENVAQRYKVLVGLENPLGSSYLVFLFCAYMAVAMFQKPMGGLMTAVLFVQIVVVVEVYSVLRDQWSQWDRKGDDDGNSSVDLSQDTNQAEDDGSTAPFSLIFLFSVVLIELGQKAYFTTGHQFTMSSIQWELSFVGLFEVSWIWSPVMMNLNTFGCPILGLLSIPLLACWKRRVAGGGLQDRLATELGASYLLGVFCIGLWGLSATALAGHFRRHLMVWSVYAPKFLGTDVGMVSLAIHYLVFGAGAVWLAWESYRRIFDVLVARGF